MYSIPTPNLDAKTQVMRDTSLNSPSLRVASCVGQEDVEVNETLNRRTLSRERCILVDLLDVQGVVPIRLEPRSVHDFLNLKRSVLAHVFVIGVVWHEI